MVAALSVYETLGSSTNKKEKSRHSSSITRKHSDFSNIAQGISKIKTKCYTEYTPKLAFDRAILQNNIRQAKIYHSDLEEIRQHIKISRYKYGNGKSLFVQKQLFTSFDVESILDRLDTMNSNINENNNKLNFCQDKIMFTSYKEVLRYNNFKKGNYDIYNRIDVLVG